MWVKICGLTRYEDAQAAVDFGADAIGMVFTRSQRRADPQLVKDWIGRITGVEKVGVFIDEDPAEIRELGKLLGLSAVQIHAPLSAAHAALAREFDIIWACKNEVKCNNAGCILPFAELGMSGRILIDASMGYGMVSSWEPRPFPFILAGGLHADNVAPAIIQARPAGVDVSSGVETAPGIKDKNLIERFIKEAKKQ